MYTLYMYIVYTNMGLFVKLRYMRAEPYFIQVKK